MNNPVIKYLSPTTGKYEYATIKGLGDLALLQTQVKTDIVSAINELIIEGVSGGGMTDDEREKLQNIENTVGALKDGTFIIKEWTSVDDYYQSKLNETIDIINRSNKETIELEKEQIIEMIQEATDSYQESVTNMNAVLESARDNVSNAEQLLIDKAAQLELADIDYTELSQTVDTINGIIEDKVQSIDFDLFNAMTTDYQTLVTQTANKWGVVASKDSLSYMSGRVETNKAEIDVQGDLIRSKVGYDEWQYLPVNIGEYNDNLLPYTRDLSGPWTRSNSAIYVSSDTFQHTKVVAIEQNGSYYSIDAYDDLEVGTTYTASIWVNIQDLDKDASEAKYEPNNTIQDVKVMIGSQLHATEIYEDLRGVNGWAHHQVQFVADSVNPIFSPRIGFNHNTQIAYMTAPKLELGDKVTGWQPHVDDDYATIYSSRSLIRQQGNEIATFVGKVEVLDDLYREATSSFSQIAEGFELSTQAIEDYEQAVLLYGAEVQAFNTSFSAKVWEQDFANAIEGINIDTRNRVYNSTFDITRYNEETREMEVPYWDGNDGSVVKLDGENDEKESFLKLSRAGLQNVNITAMTSNKFKTRNGERLIFSFNANHANLDNDSVFAIEILDIRDVRLRKVEFALSELSQEPLSNGIIRYTGAYTVSHEDVAKARVMIQLPKNGTLHVNKVLVQAADIARTDWTPAPEDSQLVRSIQEAELVILKDEISQRVRTQDIDQTTGLVINQEGKLTISPQSIISTVSNVELLGDVALINGTQFEQRVDGWRQKLVDDGTVINDINASPGLYQINFDRVAINGELLAKKISAYSLDVADGFRLVNGPIPIIEANSDGEITLNIQKLKINALSDIVAPDGSTPASKKDLENIELTPGPQGEDGIAGKDGVGVSNTKISYATSASGTVRPNNWVSDVPVSQPGTYIWTRTEWTYTDGTNEYAYSVSRIGKDGNTGTDGVAGKDGVGIKTTTLNYASSTNGTTTPSSGWQPTVPTVAAGNYLWTRTTWTYTDNSSENGYTVSRIGKDGNTGSNGAPGKDGVGITKTVIHYASSTNGTTAPTSGWATTVPSVAVGSYLWTRTVWTYTDSTNETGYSVGKMGNTGPTGARGPTGPQGVSITKVDVQYYLSTSNASLTGGVWSTTAPAWIDGRFMWSKTVTTYTSGSPTESKPVCITGAKGTTGSTGGTGATGRGVSSIVEEFYLSNSKTTQTGGSWSTTMPTWSVGKYVWTRSFITYTTGTPTTSTTEPLVSSEWEAINELKIGGVNLLRKNSWGSYSSYNTIPTQEGNIITFKKVNTNASTAVSNISIPYGADVVYTASGIAKINGVPVTNSTWGGYKGLSTYQGEVLSFEIDNTTGRFVITQKWTNSSQWLLHGNIFPSALNSIITIESFQLEKGNKATDWTEAPEDVQLSIGEKADGELTNKAIQEAKQLAYTAQQEAEAKASREQVDALESMYQGMESARQQDMTNVSGSLDTALSRVAAIETNLGDQAQQINFMNTHIRMSNEGLILGDDQQGNYLLQQPHRLDFISNGTVVAYVSNNELWINSGIFTDRLKIGDVNIVKQGTNRIRFE